MKLKAIGFWYSDTERNYRDPKMDVGDYTSETDKQRLVAYLESGQLFVDYMGYAYCRLGCTLPAELGSSDFTDGVWVWPEGLSHYIESHSVVLAPEFIKHVASNNWTMPTVQPGIIDSEYDYSYCRNDRTQI